MSIVERDAEYEIVEVDSSSALEAINRSEIDIQISTAKRYPRSIREFKRQATEMACLSESVAGTMFYVLPRGGKKLEGPSVRLAEVVGSSWGNLRYGSRVVATDDKFVTAQGMCFDLEKNVSAAVEVKRRITDKNGKRFNDDMIQVTSNAACSIALRQAIFKVVPFSMVKEIYEEAKLVSIGKAVSLADKRHKMVEWFSKTGATEAQLLTFLGRKGADDITTDDLVTLRGVANAIRDGETTIEDALAPPDGTAGAKASKSDLNDRFSDKPKEPAATPASDSPEPLADLDDRLEQATELLQVNSIEASYCGPESTLTQEQVDIVVRACEAKREAIKGTRGGRKQKELA